VKLAFSLVDKDGNEVKANPSWDGKISFKDVVSDAIHVNAAQQNCDLSLLDAKERMSHYLGISDHTVHNPNLAATRIFRTVLNFYASLDTLHTVALM
jgi:hypothetical protein